MGIFNFRMLFVVLLSLWIASMAGCGGSSETDADKSDIAKFENSEGVTPFISVVKFRSSSFDNISGLSFRISPKPGSASKSVRVSHSLASMVNRGFISSDSKTLSLPIFGLYQNYSNSVEVEFQFKDASRKSLAFTIDAPAYVEPNAVYDRPEIIKKRAPGSSLGFDFFALKSVLGTPVIIDTDAEIRWVGTGIQNSLSSAFKDGMFFIGTSPSTISRLELDGQITSFPLSKSVYTNFHHNIDPGKSFLMSEMDLASNIETVLVEFDAKGEVLKEWDFAKIVGDFMQQHGDDPAAFVRSGVDWFHMNAAVYDASDDSIIVSSRENFVIKVDYSSGAIIWILGDPQKYWYTFPSLRSKALVLEAGGLYPIGQHALSITSDGLLMLFNDGFQSLSQPPGAPVGASRNYSAISTYNIDLASKTAKEVWSFDYGKQVYSDICSSAYEASEKSILVDYAVAQNRSRTRLVGLDVHHDVVFDFQYQNGTNCNTGWNAIPIRLDDLKY